MFMELRQKQKVEQNAQVFVRGGKASDLVNNGGNIYIGGSVGDKNYGGKVTGMTMNSGSVNVTNGSFENSTVNGGYVRIEDNGTADDIKLNSGVTVHVINGYFTKKARLTVRMWKLEKGQQVIIPLLLAV